MPIQYKTEGIRVSDTGEVHPWPAPGHVVQRDEHLLCGITVEAAEDFLDAVGFPKSGKAIGYDVVTHIREFLTVMNYQLFSVVEILMAVGYPGVGEFPVFFLSHVQAEPWADTRKGMLTGAKWHDSGAGRWFLRPFHTFPSCPVWVDYFVHRQLQPDLAKADVRKAIQSIGSTVLLCRPLHWNQITPEATRRLWCIFEMFCTSQGKGAMTIEVNMLYLISMKWQNYLRFVQDAKATDEQDKQGILAELGDDLGWVNDTISRLFLRRWLPTSVTSSYAIVLIAGFIGIVGPLKYAFGGSLLFGIFPLVIFIDMMRLWKVGMDRARSYYYTWEGLDAPKLGLEDLFVRYWDGGSDAPAREGSDAPQRMPLSPPGPGPAALPRCLRCFQRRRAARAGAEGSGVAAHPIGASAAVVIALPDLPEDEDEQLQNFHAASGTVFKPVIP